MNRRRQSSGARDEDAVVLSGEIDMEMDDSIVTLRAGDVLVQRGTIHDWINRSDKPCVIAFVLIDARPVEQGGKTLPAHGWSGTARDRVGLREHS